MNTILRLAGIVRPFTFWILLAVLLGVASIGSSIGLFMAAAWIIAKASLTSSLVQLQLGMIGVRIFGLSRGILRYTERLVSHNTTFRILTRLRVWFYDSIEPLAPARLMNYRSGDLLQRIVDDIQSLENLYVRVIAPPLTALLVSIIMWLLLGIFSIQAVLLLLLFQLLAGIAVPLVTMRAGRGVASGIMAAQTEQQIAAVDFAQGMGELWLYGRTEEHIGRMASLRRDITALQRKQGIIQGMHESLIGLLMNASVIAILATLLPAAQTGISGGISSAIVALAVIASFEAFLPIPAAMQHLEADIRAGNRLFDIIDATPEVKAPSTPRPFPQEHTISARSLSFAYPGAIRRSLDNVTFTIPHGGKTAIVGPSGAGKTTIGSLLLRFWNTPAGSLTIGGTDIASFDPEELRRHIGVVSQRTYLFGQSIRNNLLLAAPEADTDTLLSALSAAGLDSLKGRLDDWAGQHGMNLSGGERQRIAIARMLLQKAPIILLDEATANLDAITEAALLKTIESAAEGKTLLAITHRLREMEWFDHIIVLHEGRIIEEGRHQELLDMNGFYAGMWRMQHEGA